jgi:hypothetical protein
LKSPDFLILLYFMPGHETHLSLCLLLSLPSVTFLCEQSFILSPSLASVMGSITVKERTQCHSEKERKNKIMVATFPIFALESVLDILFNYLSLFSKSCGRRLFTFYRLRNWKTEKLMIFPESLERSPRNVHVLLSPTV